MKSHLASGLATQAHSVADHPGHSWGTAMSKGGAAGLKKGVVNKRAKITVVHKVKTSGTTEKDQCLLHMQKAVSCGLLKGRDILLGFNSVMKLVESGRANAIVSFRDTPPCIFNALSEIARHRSIPLIAFGRISSEFASALGIKKVSCVGIPFASHEHDGDSLELGIALDQLRDYVVEIAKLSHHSSNDTK